MNSDISLGDVLQILVIIASVVAIVQGLRSQMATLITTVKELAQAVRQLEKDVNDRIVEDTRTSERLRAVMARLSRLERRAGIEQGPDLPD